MIGYLEEKNGSDRISGDLDPAAEYQRVRDAASDILHGEATLTDVSGLDEKTITWFNRMFAPPETVVRELRALAAEPWSGQPQIERLRTLTSSQHHLRSSSPG
ncbi:hypothetical protein L3Q67_31805 [Saccharothrix sp. AJ9571]|nr:hypothetical protein L3Q67_31805 [Saccharothrix sp. AJ9571]